MAHGAYQSVKKGNSSSAAEKRQHQLELFSQADLCLAVGPMLRSHLWDLLPAGKNVETSISLSERSLSDP